MNAPRRGGLTENTGISLVDMKFCMGDECDKNDIDNMEMRQAPACFFQSLARRNHTTFLPNDLTFGTSQESGTHKSWTMSVSIHYAVSSMDASGTYQRKERWNDW